MPNISPSTSANTAIEQDVSTQKGNDLVPNSAPESPLIEPESQTQSQTQAETGGEEKENEVPAEKPPEEQQPDISGLKRALIILPATLVYFLVMLDSSIISTAIPQITDEFNSLLDVGWYGSAYQLASSAFVPLAGKIYKFFPIKVSCRCQVQVSVN
jgi:hypothetical protein